MYDPSTKYDADQIYEITEDLPGEEISDFLQHLMRSQPDLDINWEELVAEAYHYSLDAINPLAASERLIGDPEAPFVLTVYLYKLQEAYLASKSGQKPIDLNDFLEAQYSLWSRDDDTIHKVLKTLERSLDLDMIRRSMLEGSHRHMLELNVQFMKHMFETHGIPFMLSDIWWSFISYKSLFNQRKNKAPEVWFFLDIESLNGHLDQILDSMTGVNDIEVYGKVWGLKYIYDFLHQYQVISDDVAEKMKLNILSCKERMVNFMARESWVVNFASQWPE